MGLLDALEADSIDDMIQKHQDVSGASGVGFGVGLLSNDINNLSNSDDSIKNGGYLYVTVEDSVRGLHLDGLDTVIVIGRPFGPDEYTHIAGRTGRAGQTGNVINILNKDDAWKINAWESMLNVPFINLDAAGYTDLIYKKRLL